MLYESGISSYEIDYGDNTVFLYVISLRTRDKAKDKYGMQAYAKDNSLRKQHKRFHDEFGDEPDALDELPSGESYRNSYFIPIIDSLISALSKRIAAYSHLSEKFSFFANLGLEETSRMVCASQQKN